MSDDNIKRFIIDRLKWLGIYLGVGFILVFLLPFPYDFISVLGLFILVNFFRMRSLMKRYGGMGGIKQSLSSSMSGNQYRPLKYYCMSCGKEHSKIACPDCGSKNEKSGLTHHMRGKPRHLDYLYDLQAVMDNQSLKKKFLEMS
jgi:hypothetical protein